MIPELYKDHINTEVYIDFDWLDRLRILFGYRVKVEIRTLCENLPGRVESQTTVHIFSNQHKKEVNNGYTA